jgi:hypothetical protein
MKLPNNLATTKEKLNKNDIEIVKIDVGEPKSFSYNFYEFDDEKKLKKYIKSIESLVRNSIEYRNYTKYLKEEQDLTACKFLSNVDGRDIKGVSIELHHYPFNLYEIVDTVLKKQTDFYSHSTNKFEVANEVMRIHYENIIGLVPLTKTVHELAHNGEVFINLGFVYGNVKKFIEIYNEYISQELFDALETLTDLSNKNALQSNNYILKKKFQQIIMENQLEAKTIISDSDELKLA